jgi:hypothetical protein
MSARGLLILLLGIGGILVAMLVMRGTPDRGESGGTIATREDGIDPGGSKGPHTTHSEKDTKARLRPPSPVLTEEETIDLLRSTIIERFVVDDASWEDCVGMMNQAIRKAGIPEDHLHVEIDARDRQQIGQFRVRELRLHNAPLWKLNQHLCGNTKVRCRVGAGIVSFCSSTTYFHEMQREDGKAPFGQDDPFSDSPQSGTSSESEEEDDPFGP